MVHPSIIEARLGKLGFKSSRWFKAEVNELQHILMDDEKVIALACGRYFGSFALLVATDQRLLLIDKRVFFMTIEDTRYDMISEIDFNAQAYSATVTVYTMNKTHKFTSIKHRQQLRQLTNYVQRRVWEFRQQQSALNEGSAVPMFSNATQQFTARPAPVPVSEYQVGQAAQHQPLAAQPNDYYIDDHTGGHAWRGQLGHVAHKVGTAATKAAHTPHLPIPHPQRPFNPYTQGSLMTRRPLSTPEDYYSY